MNIHHYTDGFLEYSAEEANIHASMEDEEEEYQIDKDDS
jgi:hypothetical protein